jgi:hypothetical protein
MTETTAYRQILTWLAQHPGSTARQVAGGIGYPDSVHVRAMLVLAERAGRAQRHRTGAGPWLWEAPDPQPDLDAMINTLPCEFCRAGPGQRCMYVRGAKAGRPYLYPHATRHQAAIRAGIIDDWKRLHAEWAARNG